MRGHAILIDPFVHKIFADAEVFAYLANRFDNHRPPISAISQAPRGLSGYEQNARREKGEKAGFPG